MQIPEKIEHCPPEILKQFIEMKKFSSDKI